MEGVKALPQKGTGLRIQGTITFVTGDRRFGFIDGNTFIHCSAVSKGLIQFEKYAKVEQDAEWDTKKHRMNANNVVVFASPVWMHQLSQG